MYTIAIAKQHSSHGKRLCVQPRDSLKRNSSVLFQVVARHRGYTSAFQEGECLLGAAVQQALGPKKDKSALQHAATIADGLAVQYVIDAMRASSKQQGSAVEPKHIEVEPW